LKAPPDFFYWLVSCELASQFDTSSAPVDKRHLVHSRTAHRLTSTASVLRCGVYYGTGQLSHLLKVRRSKGLRENTEKEASLRFPLAIEAMFSAALPGDIEIAIVRFGRAFIVSTTRGSVWVTVSVVSDRHGSDVLIPALS